MTISPELQLALFALDSYNRGYGSGLVDEQPASGDVDGLGTIGSGLAFGTMIRESDTAEGSPGVEAGFYAAAYSVASGNLAGKTVISFRGTDNAAGEGEGGNDIVNGWFGGQGTITRQLEQALEFYDSVIASGVHPDDIVLTGHSLGGGLAGFVAMLKGVEGHGFDHMPFGAAVEAYIAENGYFLDADGNDIVPDYSGFTAAHVEGDILSDVRDGTIQGIVAGTLITAFGGTVFADNAVTAVLNTLGLDTEPGTLGLLGHALTAETTAQIEASITMTTAYDSGVDTSPFSLAERATYFRAPRKIAPDLSTL